MALVLSFENFATWLLYFTNCLLAWFLWSEKNKIPIEIMCAISLQYDQRNPAAVKMLEAILAAGLFTVCPSVPSQMTMEELNAEMDQAEEDVKNGRVLSGEAMNERMNRFVQKYA